MLRYSSILRPKKYNKNPISIYYSISKNSIFGSNTPNIFKNSFNKSNNFLENNYQLPTRKFKKINISQILNKPNKTYTTGEKPLYPYKLNYTKKMSLNLNNEFFSNEIKKKKNTSTFKEVINKISKNLISNSHISCKINYNSNIYKKDGTFYLNNKKSNTIEVRRNDQNLNINKSSKSFTRSIFDCYKKTNNNNINNKTFLFAKKYIKLNINNKINSQKKCRKCELINKISLNKNNVNKMKIKISKNNKYKLFQKDLANLPINLISERENLNKKKLDKSKSLIQKCNKKKSSKTSYRNLDRPEQNNISSNKALKNNKIKNKKSKKQNAVFEKFFLTFKSKKEDAKELESKFLNYELGLSDEKSSLSYNLDNTNNKNIIDNSNFEFEKPIEEIEKLANKKLNDSNYKWE